MGEEGCVQGHWPVQGWSQVSSRGLPHPAPRLCCTPQVVPSAGQATCDQGLGLSQSLATLMLCDLGQVTSPLFHKVGVRSPPSGGCDAHIVK